MLRLRRSSLLLMIALLIAAGCSSSDDDAETPSSTTAAVATTAVPATTEPSTTDTVAPESTDDDPTAVLASIDGIDITAAMLNEELTLAGEFGEANPEQAAALADPDDPEIRAQLLADLLISTLLVSRLDEAGTGVTEAQRTSIADSIPPGLVSTPWLDRFIERSAVYQAYSALAASESGLPGTAEEWFAANPDALGEIACSRHILLETEDEALAVRARIVDGGEDFATVAQEASTGPSGPNGGDLGCDDPSGFVDEFAEAVRTLPINEVSQPVETQFGFHVIEVTGRGPESLGDEEFTSRITDRYNFEVSTVGDTAIADLLAAAAVTVDPSIGTWNADSRSIDVTG